MCFFSYDNCISLQLDEAVHQYREQMQHVDTQIEELHGCDGDKDALDLADLQRQREVLQSRSKLRLQHPLPLDLHMVVVQAYREQAEAAEVQLQELEQQFQQAVAEIMELQPSPQLQAVIEEQQHLCNVHVGADLCTRL